MSDPTDFLNRWSRRKSEAEKRESDLLGRESGTPTADSSSRMTRDGIAGDTVRDLVDLTTLPAIESITATTDIRLFLAPGVPPELKLAALRRAFVVDSKIRDFVEVADYDFDFNTPGAIAGFGPLEMTDTLRQEVARIAQGFLSESETPSTPAAVVASHGPSEPVQAVDGNGVGNQASLQGTSRQQPPNDPVNRNEKRGDVAREQGSQSAAISRPANSEHEDSRLPAQQTHGSALPK